MSAAIGGRSESEVASIAQIPPKWGGLAQDRRMKRKFWARFVAGVCLLGVPQGARAADEASPVPLAERCARLAGSAIAASDIALPTGGGTVDKAVFVPGEGEAASKGFCEVDGRILPVDPHAPAIHFNIALPAEWNGRALHLMGGGWDGFVVKGASAVVGGGKLKTPAMRGYAAFGSDSGHSHTDPDWQMNDEAFENFAGDQLRKTHDAALAIIVRNYGREPQRSFSAGGSGGGREALYVADRWPELYDGVIAFFPVWSAVGSFLGWIDNAQALAKPGAWSPPELQAAISRDVVERCDALDGAVDGLVANLAACRIAPESLACSEKEDRSDCLSSAQVAGLVAAYQSAKPLPFKLSNGVDRFHAYNVLDGGAQPRMGKVAPGGRIAAENSFFGPKETAFGAALSDPFVRFVVLRDPAADLFAFRPDMTAAVRDRLLYLSRRMDVDPAMSAFVAKGGKLLLVHGNADQVHPGDWSDEFYRRAIAAHGPARTASYLRYYRVPGYGHGGGVLEGGRFDLQVDLLTALERWTEEGVPPAGLIATDIHEDRRGRTRPLCEYPTFARYKGSGDIDSAASFSCSAK